jgi:flagellar hook-associated protein 1 FlgK
MSSTFLGIEIGKRSLNMHQKGMHVIGHNLANADNEIYSKQRVMTRTVSPLTEPGLNREERPGQIGQGTEVSAVRRDRDIYLDVRINTELNMKEYWSENHKILTQIENISQALGDENLQERLDTFWKGWQDLSIYPAEPAVRQDLKQNAVSLAKGINNQFNNLFNLRMELNQKVQNGVMTVNRLAENIAEVNTHIKRIQNLGDNPNDLLDRRDALVEELAQWVNVKTSYRDDDEHMVFVGGKILVQGGITNPLALEPRSQNEGLDAVIWERNGDDIMLDGGKLKAFIENRDINVTGQMRDLDSFAQSLKHAVNELHRSGFDYYGKPAQDFFTESYITNHPLGHYDSNGDGIDDKTYIYSIHGNQRMAMEDVIGEDGTIRLVHEGRNYDITYQRDMTVRELIKEININNPNVSAYLNPEGNFAFKASNRGSDAAFAISHIEDDGNFLTGVAGLLRGSGTANAFDANGLNAVNQFADGALYTVRTPASHPAAWLRVNRDILSDSNLIAAGDGTDYDGDGVKEKSNGTGDGDIALKIAGLRDAAIRIGGKDTLNEFYVNMVDDIAGKAFFADKETQKFEAVMNGLLEVRSSISGVNIDEEVADMLAMQHGYQAGARVVSVMDELLDTIINRMAV